MMHFKLQKLRKTFQGNRHSDKTDVVVASPANVEPEGSCGSPSESRRAKYWHLPHHAKAPSALPPATKNLTQGTIPDGPVFVARKAKLTQGDREAMDRVWETQLAWNRAHRQCQTAEL
eukprot:c19862_g1_i1.p1 GENE.c19862_g1_i1~~c19862_g1_i1.p1  ORF type:complete len:137 (+),score=16.77 c19862_g1_i1:60-413(+)